MWHKRKVFYSLILFFMMSACQPAQTETLPVEAPQIIKIGIQPTIGYLKEPIAACADQDASYDVLLLEKNSYDWTQEPVDIVFTSQYAVDGLTNTFLVDEVDISIIVSTDFPTYQLNTSHLQAIFNTEPVSPTQIGLAENDTITIYGFESGSDMAAMFEYQYGFQPQLPVDAFLAVSPQSVVEKIANGTTAIGYTLSPTVTDQVKILNIAIDNETSPIPIIASFKTELIVPQEALISCLQTTQSE